MSKGFVFGCFLGVFVLACLQRVNGQGFFRIMNGIPHLPVMNDPTSIATPAVGSIVINTASCNNCGTPGSRLVVQVYNGAEWMFISDEAAAVTSPDTKFSIKGGIPALAVDDPDGWTPSAGDAYFSITQKAFVVHNSSDFVRLAAFTGSLPQSTGSGISNDGKLFKIPILGSAPSGVQDGAIYFKQDGTLQIFQNGGWNDESTCTIIINHVAANGVAPIDTTITYKVVEYDNKCWLAQNLGAARQAKSATEGGEEPRGWFWQFSRKQGYKPVGSDYTTTLIPSGKWEYEKIGGNSDWIDQDPCHLELKNGWRLPNINEWVSADNWSTPDEGYLSDLKLHGAGFLHIEDYFANNGKSHFWSSTNTNTDWANSFGLFSRVPNRTKEHGFSVRCVKDL